MLPNVKSKYWGSSAPYTGHQRIAWFGDEHTSTLPPSSRKARLADPKRVAAKNASLKPSNEPQAALIASANSPEGSPPPSGDITPRKAMIVITSTIVSKCSVAHIQAGKNILIELPSRSVPATALFKLFVYPLWCFPQCISMVSVNVRFQLVCIR